MEFHHGKPHIFASNMKTWQACQERRIEPSLLPSLSTKFNIYISQSLIFYFGFRKFRIFYYRIYNTIN